MTEYGQEPGSHPWYPDDPFQGTYGAYGAYGDYGAYADYGAYGDQGWGYEAQYAAQSDPYAAQAQHYGQPASYGQQAPHGYGGQYGQPAPYAQYPAYEQYATYEQPDPYRQFPHQQHQQAYAAQDFATGAPGAPGAPYAQPPSMPHQHPYDWGAGQPMAPADAAGYAQPPQPPPPAGRSGPGTAPMPVVDPGMPGHGEEPFPSGADPETGWDPGPDRGEHAFFADRDEDDWDGEDDGPGRGRRGDRPERPGKQRSGKQAGKQRPGKRRSGCACMGASLALLGVVGTVGYFGYEFYRDHFGPPPDYAGKGTGQAQVTVSGGDGIADMGRTLQHAGVVRSPGAFVEAAHASAKGDRIQPGTYSLRKHMSGRAAVTLMLSPASQNALIVPEGARAKAIYHLIDEKLDARPGTTAKAARTADLKLPSWAKGKPEGLLYPSRYSVGKHADPADVLREMVQRGKAEQAKVDLVGKAKKTDRTPEEVLTVASLIQAEAQEDDDFGKVSRVIGNRLDKRMRLGFDSTINYAKGRSSLNTSVGDTRYRSPYNTYLHSGLPPGPIDSPGPRAVEAALNPTPGRWLYFVTVKAGDTRFAATKAEHDRNVREFNEEQRKKKENGG